MQKLLPSVEKYNPLRRKQFARLILSTDPSNECLCNVLLFWPHLNAGKKQDLHYSAPPAVSIDTSSHQQTRENDKNCKLRQMTLPQRILAEIGKGYAWWVDCWRRRESEHTHRAVHPIQGSRQPARLWLSHPRSTIKFHYGELTCNVNKTGILSSAVRMNLHALYCLALFSVCHGVSLLIFFPYQSVRVQMCLALTFL